MAPSNSRVFVERRWASIHWLMNSAGLSVLSVSSGSAGSWASSSLLRLHLSFSCSNPIFSASTPSPITDVRVWASLNSLYSAPLAGDALIQLYHNFITDFETKINLLKLAHFAVIVSRQYSEKEAAISYLYGIIEKLQATKEQHIEEPILYIRMQIAMFKLEQGEQKECKKLLEDGKSTLDSMTDIDPSVYASFYWVSSQYHKFRQEFSEFYKAALLYLAYTSVESLSESFKLDLAFDLSLSALLGDNIYNFGELLAHPIVEKFIQEAITKAFD